MRRFMSYCVTLKHCTHKVPRAERLMIGLVYEPARMAYLLWQPLLSVDIYTCDVSHCAHHWHLNNYHSLTGFVSVDFLC